MFTFVILVIKKFPLFISTYRSTVFREKDQAWGKKKSTYYNEDEEEELSSAAEEEVLSFCKNSYNPAPTS